MSRHWMTQWATAACFVVVGVVSLEAYEDRDVGQGWPNCPVMGEPADGKIFVEHNGRDIQFCCKGCIKKFMRDPSQ